VPQRKRGKRGKVIADRASSSPAGLLVGAHLATPRRGYVHHGIYVGDGQVVHYSGLAQGLRRGPIELATLTEFSRGRPLWEVAEPLRRFSGTEAARRAISRIGEDRYHVLTNNCEHFTGWCLHGIARSEQVEAMLAAPRRILKVANDSRIKLRVRAERQVATDARRARASEETR
jgi:Lecithin retinol acyltransferase